MSETPAMRALRGRAAAYHRWSMVEDRSAATAPARKAAMDRFEKQVDPTGDLDPAERTRRGEMARRAFYSMMAYRSVKARQSRARRRDA